MELRHLRYFRVVAELQHFHRAAEVLCITQPALSNQIRQLEEELGTRLFERVGRSVRLSESGELLLASTRRVLAEVERMQEAVADLESANTGSLRIGVLQSINALYLRNLVVEFDRRYPNISLHIEELPNHQIESRVAAGDIDLGIGFILEKEYRHVEFETLFSEKWKLVVAPQHQELIPEILDGNTHGLKAVLLPDYFETRRIVDRYFASSGIGYSRITEVNSISCILELVENGNAFTVLPEAFSALHAQHRLVSHYIDGLAPRQIGVLLAKDRARKRSVARFRELVADYVQAEH